MTEPKARSNGFLMLDRNFLRSEQVAALSTKAGWLLIAIADRYNGRNNGAIPYSTREAEAWLHCGRGSAHRAFRELESAGFIKAVERGSFSLKSGRGRATTWRLNFL